MVHVIYVIVVAHTHQSAAAGTAPVVLAPLTVAQFALPDNRHTLCGFAVFKPQMASKPLGGYTDQIRRVKIKKLYMAYVHMYLYIYINNMCIYI